MLNTEGWKGRSAAPEETDTKDSENKKKSVGEATSSPLIELHYVCYELRRRSSLLIIVLGSSTRRRSRNVLGAALAVAPGLVCQARGQGGAYIHKVRRHSGAYSIAVY